MQQGVVDGRLDDAGSPQLGDRCLTTRHICGANRATTSRLTQIRYDEVWQSSRGEYGHGCLRDQQSMTRWRHRSSSRRFAWCQRDAHIPVTYCPRAYPRAPLVEDVDADSLISENRGRQCVLYVDSWSCLPLAWWCGGWTRARSWPSDHCASCQHAGVASGGDLRLLLTPQLGATHNSRATLACRVSWLHCRPCLAGGRDASRRVVTLGVALASVGGRPSPWRGAP